MHHLCSIIQPLWNIIQLRSIMQPLCRIMQPLSNIKRMRKSLEQWVSRKLERPRSASLRSPQSVENIFKNTIEILKKTTNIYKYLQKWSPETSRDPPVQFEVYISSILAPFDSILDPLWSIWAPLGHLGLIFGVFGHQRGSLRHQSGAKGSQKSPKRAPESPQRVPRSSKIPLSKKKKNMKKWKNSIIHWVFAPKSGRKSRRTNCPRNP